ncbi:MAG: hypothetical protein V4674_03325 [Patescibacteria group bacterium]
MEKSEIDARQALVGYVFVAMQQLFAGLEQWKDSPSIYIEYSNLDVEGNFQAFVTPSNWPHDDQLVISMQKHEFGVYSFDAISFPSSDEGHQIELVCVSESLPKMLSPKDPDLFEKYPPLLGLPEYGRLISHSCAGFRRFYERWEKVDNEKNREALAAE